MAFRRLQERAKELGISPRSGKGINAAFLQQKIKEAEEEIRFQEEKRRRQEEEEERKREIEREEKRRLSSENEEIVKEMNPKIWVAASLYFKEDPYSGFDFTTILRNLEDLEKDKEARRVLDTIRRNIDEEILELSFEPGIDDLAFKYYALFDVLLYRGDPGVRKLYPWMLGDLDMREQRRLLPFAHHGYSRDMEYHFSKALDELTPGEAIEAQIYGYLYMRPLDIYALKKSPLSELDERGAQTLSSAYTEKEERKYREGVASSLVSSEEALLDLLQFVVKEKRLDLLRGIARAVADKEWAIKRVISIAHNDNWPEGVKEAFSFVDPEAKDMDTGYLVWAFLKDNRPMIRALLHPSQYTTDSLYRVLRGLENASLEPIKPWLAYLDDKRVNLAKMLDFTGNRERLPWLAANFPKQRENARKTFKENMTKY